MQIIDIQTEGLKQSFKVSVPSSTIENMISKKLDEIGNQVSLAGFRKGKVPKQFLRQKYGASVVGEALEDVVREVSMEIIKEKKLQPALQPKFQISSFTEGKDLEFSMDVENLPEVSLCDLAKLSLVRQVVDVDDEEINKAIDRISLNVKDSVLVSEARAANKGDVVVIDFVGKVDGLEFAGGKGEAYHLELGSGSFIPGFEEQLVGAKVGDEVVVKVQFPQAYHSKDLQGKDAEFDVKIKELRENTKPEINDEFAKKFGQETLVDLKNLIQAEIKKEYDMMSRSYLKKELLDLLSDKHDFELPEGMVSLEFDAIWRQLEEAKKKDSLDESDKNKTDEELQTEYKSIASRRVKLGIVLAEIGKKHEVVVGQDDVNRALLAEARRYPGQEDKVIEFYQKQPQMLENLKAPIFEEKVVDFIISKADVSEIKTTIEALQSLLMGDDSSVKTADKKAKTSSKNTEKTEKETKAVKKTTKTASKKTESK